MRISPETTPELVGHVRVALNGEDVTAYCRQADDAAGEVLLLCKDEDHHRALAHLGEAHVFRADAWETVREHRLRGVVRIEQLNSGRQPVDAVEKH